MNLIDRQDKAFRKFIGQLPPQNNCVPVQIETFLTFCIVTKANKPNKPRNETAPCYAI